ncbi:NAD(P)H-dependent oxidoreductase [uncultured Acetobacteroides sp.]|uniref:NAD(P)H-dependent oxidoreductase n=1 Tax=uncultured Acetobacteroides sp. TaxID=1760811 RepID=UPI0029F54B11|nr:NAD(P)H-dependent oxidoreductase [uncultured Acetobacteroides sp.]
MGLLNALSWRYATKRMNGQKVPSEKVEPILESIRLSASSFGLQPYRVIVVDDPALKAKIHESACQQPQIVEASHLLVFASWKTITPEHIDSYISLVAKERNMPVEELAQFDGMLKDFLASRTQERLSAWATRQAYIGLGTGLIAAAMEQIDATPMEGFNTTEMDKVLGLDKTNLQSVAILALGYRDTANDYLVNQKKVRVSKEEFFIYNR